MQPPLLLPSSNARGADQPGPRIDFEVLAKKLNAQVLRPTSSRGLVGRLPPLGRLDWRQALTARRTGASVYVSFSERPAVPLSLLGVDVPHVMIGHQMTSPSKRALAGMTGYLRRLDRIVVFAHEQRRHLVDTTGVAPERVVFIPDKVDDDFFRPSLRPLGPDPYVLSVGREQRDYDTLTRAVAGTGIHTVIVPGSSWSTDAEHALSTPAEVEIRRNLSFPALRDLYQGASVVVVPIRAGTRYAAGVNGVLEAMACGRATIVSNTPGITDYVKHGHTGRLVAAESPQSLRSEIVSLLDDPTRADAMGHAARAAIEREYTLQHFVDRMTGVIAGVATTGVWQ